MLLVNLSQMLGLEIILNLNLNFKSAISLELLRTTVGHEFKLL